MEKVTVISIQKKKKSKDILTALTCYDAFTGKLVDEAGIDIALVGDSLANTRLGYANTIPVTLEEMLHHTKAASRGVQRALLVADLPFMTYELSAAQAAQSAGRFIKEGGAHAVKVEGGKRIGPSITAMLKANIAVMGHIGLTPQSYYKDGGYRVKGVTPAQVKDLKADAKYLEQLGVFSLVLEGMRPDVAKAITRSLKIPTIGIGAGPDCDGQILVLDDLLGLTENSPKFVKKYARLRQSMLKAIQAYKKDVESRHFPGLQHSY